MSYSGMSALGASEYNGIPIVRGKKYQVWFTRPGVLTNTLWAIIYAGKSQAWRYMDYWNRAYKSRFEITKEPVLQPDTIYIEGIGGPEGEAKNETFGTLALDQYWARGRPLYINNVRRGLEQVDYYKIADENGKDLLAEQYEPPLVPSEPSPKTPTSPTGYPPSENASPASLSGKSSLPWVLGGVGLVGVLVTTILLASRGRKNVSTV